MNQRQQRFSKPAKVPLGDLRLVIHSCLGARVNSPWALALTQAFRDAMGTQPEVMVSDDGINWTHEEFSLYGEELVSVMWTGSRFAAMSSWGDCLISPDGVSWTNLYKLTVTESVGGTASVEKTGFYTNDTPIEISAVSSPARRSRKGWPFSSGSGGTYAVYRDTQPGFQPSAVNRVASGVSVTSWTDPAPPAVKAAQAFCRWAVSSSPMPNSSLIILTL